MFSFLDHNADTLYKHTKFQISTTKVHYNLVPWVELGIFPIVSKQHIPNYLSEINIFNTL